MIHIGTMGWGYAFWRGNFYPESLPTEELLSYYSKQFDTVEINNTFYRIPNAQTMNNWKQQVGKAFAFSLKFPRIITHVKMLKDCREETNFFLERVKLLGSKLGPLLLQLPPAFNEAYLPLLEQFLQELPKNRPYVVEVRNKTILNENLYSILRDNNVSLAWVESHLIPADETVTSDFLYVRWEGDRKKVKGVLGKREIDRNPELRSWAKKLRLFSDSNCEVFGYFSKYFSGDAPADAREFLALVGKGQKSPE
jgi:uncharacterized protein YecE (DUF72 family)